MVKTEDQRSMIFLKTKYGEVDTYMNLSLSKNTYFLWLLPIFLFIIGRSFNNLQLALLVKKN